MKEDRSERFESRFQSFASRGGPAHGAERTLALRAELGRLGLAGFIVPAPTDTRTKTFRNRTNACSGSPDFPGRPAWRSCFRTRPRCSRTVGTPCKLRRRSTWPYISRRSEERRVGKECR